MRVCECIVRLNNYIVFIWNSFPIVAVGYTHLGPPFPRNPKRYHFQHKLEQFILLLKSAQTICKTHKPGTPISSIRIRCLVWFAANCMQCCRLVGGVPNRGSVYFIISNFSPTWGLSIKLNCRAHVWTFRWACSLILWFDLAQYSDYTYYVFGRLNNAG